VPALAPIRILSSVRIILSRKGFDSANGGVASPVFPDGRLISLPIPSGGGPLCYGDLTIDGHNLGSLVEVLTHGRVTATHRAHVDRDLYACAMRRDPGWRPAFGQIDSAQPHLAAQGVGAGDLFLFFGWFREVQALSGRWQFRRGSPDRHVLFGWLQVVTCSRNLSPPET
jgi:hypothetical protein